MDTLVLLQLVATGEATERAKAFEQLDSSNEHYLPLLQSLAMPQDNRLTFWALFLLVKHHPQRLQYDADRAIPLLLTSLATGDGPIADRAAWALNIVGEPAVRALLTSIAVAPDAEEAAAYIGALRSNNSVYLFASEVLALLAKRLDSSNERVRYWALAVLMDIGPLRWRFDTRMPTEAFESLYEKLLAVAQEFVSSNQNEMATCYKDLLTQAIGRRQ